MKRAYKIAVLRIMVVAVTAMALSFSSCQDNEVCEELVNNPLRIGFYQLANDTSSSVIIDSLTVYGLDRPADSIYNNQYNVGLIEVPLDPSRDSVAFVIEFPQATDTLFVSYSRQTHLISVECGFVLYYTIQDQSSTQNFILATETTNSEIANTADEHLKIFIPPPPVIIPGI